ncbi:hypothetical protein JTM39_34080, partial [Pseudomonas aeruginosa]|nr:hypothetical protein [Pseudomonas aeruginosa]
LKPWAWPIWMVARSSTLSSVYDIGAAPYRKGQVLHSVFAAAQYIAVPSSSSPMQKAVRYSEKPMENTIATH